MDVREIKQSAEDVKRALDAFSEVEALARWGIAHFLEGAEQEHWSFESVDPDQNFVGKYEDTLEVKVDYYQCGDTDHDWFHLPLSALANKDARALVAAGKAHKRKQDALALKKKKEQERKRAEDHERREREQYERLKAKYAK